MSASSLTRRAVLQLGAAAVLAPTSTAFAAESHGPFNLADPYDRLAAYVKVRARLDAKPVYYHYFADVFAVAEGRIPQLLFKREGVSVHRARVNADRTVHLRYTECNYTQDPITGTLVDTMINPLTGKEVKPVSQPPGAGSLVHITTEGSRNPNMVLPPPSAAKMVLSAPVVSGDRVWFTDDTMFFRTAADANTLDTTIKRPGDINFAELITFEAAVSDLQNPKLISAPSTCIVGASVPWMPWLGLQEVPGRLQMRYRAHKLASPDLLPAWLKAKVAVDYPTFLTDPKLELPA